MEQHLLSHLDRHIHGEGTERCVPMIVPDRQMQSLMIICAAEEADTLVAGEKIRKFEKGQLVRVIDGTIEESWGAWRDSWDSSVWRFTLRGCSR